MRRSLILLFNTLTIFKWLKNKIPTFYPSYVCATDSPWWYSLLCLNIRIFLHISNQSNTANGRDLARPSLLCLPPKHLQHRRQVAGWPRSWACPSSRPDHLHPRHPLRPRLHVLLHHVPPTNHELGRHPGTQFDLADLNECSSLTPKLWLYDLCWIKVRKKWSFMWYHFKTSNVKWWTWNCMSDTDFLFCRIYILLLSGGGGPIGPNAYVS